MKGIFSSIGFNDLINDVKYMLFLSLNETRFEYTTFMNILSLEISRTRRRNRDSGFSNELEIANSSIKKKIIIQLVIRTTRDYNSITF